MNNLQPAYINALLADASYVKTIKKGVIEASDFSKRLTQTQANFLAANFTVKSSVETPNTINPILGTGFDAVVWEGKAGTPYAGQTYVSIRGTDGDATDLADDASLASKGLPYDQIRDMVNWWLKNTASTTDQNVVQIKVVDGAENVAFTGHSLIDDSNSDLLIRHADGSDTAKRGAGNDRLWRIAA